MDALIAELRSGEPPLPFTIALHDTPVRCTELLRHLPGKRLVCLGTAGEKSVVAKIYVDPSRAAIHARREEHGARAMLARGVRTAPLLHAGAVGAMHVVVYERIAPADTALEIWQSGANESTRTALLQRLTVTVAQHHNAGLMQEDLHLDNFLLQDDEVYTLDAAAIRVRQGPIKATEALNNLALLYAQLPPEYDEVSLQAFTEYVRLRGWTLEAALYNRLRRALQNRRKQRERLYLRKIFRSSTAFVAHRQFDRYYVCDRRDHDEAMQRALADPDSLFVQAQALKRGNTSTVIVAHIGDRDVVVKRYNLKSFGHGLRRAIQPTRAAISWRNAQRLRFYDIATPRPIALLEQRIGPLRRVAYFLSEYVPAENSAQYFARNDVDEGERKTVAQRMVELLQKLRRLRLSHGDMKATNFLIAEQQPLLIDLDAMRKHRSASSAERAWQRDLRRFMQNWAEDSAVAALFSRLLAATDSPLPERKK